MKKINIVLYSPEIPQNTGNISRTAVVTGAALHIIRPIGFEISDRTLKRAGLDYWKDLQVTYYDDYDDFVRRHPDVEIYYFSSKAGLTHTDVSYGDEVYLMFGPETRGLPESLVTENLSHAVRIPMVPNQRCRNLSNAVAVAVYEVLRQDGFDAMQTEGCLSEGE